MKDYEALDLEVIAFASGDIITASNTDDDTLLPEIERKDDRFVF